MPELRSSSCASKSPASGSSESLAVKSIESPTSKRSAPLPPVIVSWPLPRRKAFLSSPWSEPCVASFVGPLASIVVVELSPISKLTSILSQLTTKFVMELSSRKKLASVSTKLLVKSTEAFSRRSNSLAPLRPLLEPEPLLTVTVEVDPAPIYS